MIIGVGGLVKMGLEYGALRRSMLTAHTPDSVWKLWNYE